jgi:hypothetical protein
MIQSTNANIVNMQTDKAFGLTMPAGLLAIADEVIDDGAASVVCSRRAIKSGRRGAGRPAVAHLPPSMCLPCATPSNGTVVTVAPWRRKTPRQSGW